MLSAVLFVHGCNLRCAYCHNPSLVGEPPTARFDEHEILSFLALRRGQLGSVVLTGGEPTLASELRSLILQVRALGFKVKLDTNGTRPDVLEALLGDRLLDFVAMDLKDLPEAYPVLCRTQVDPQLIRRSVRIVLAASVEHEFRTTVVPPHHDIGRLNAMASVLEGAHRWALQPYRPGRTLTRNPPFQSPDVPSLQRMASRISSETGLACSCRGATSRRREPLAAPRRGAASFSPLAGVWHR
jgi:pyruvate formate lyase activating enzyme